MATPMEGTVAAWALSALQRHSHRIFKYESRVLKDRDPEDLHQLRVGMRRLRSVVAGFRGVLILPKGITEQRLGKMGRVLGVQRDNDVLQAMVRDRYLPQVDGGDRQALDRLLAYLQEERTQAFKATRKLLIQDKFADFKDQWQSWLADPQWTSLGALPLTAVLPDLLWPSLAQFFLHPGWLVGTEGDGLGGDRRCQTLSAGDLEILLAGEEPCLHDLRKAAKALRYQLEIFGEAYGADYHHFLGQVKDVQEVLGHLQDNFVLRSLIETCLDGSLETLSPTLYARFNGDRRQYWDQWQPLQTQLIDRQYRDQCRRWLLTPSTDRPEEDFPEGEGN